MIRKAEAKDKAAIAQLCYIIWDELEVDMVKFVERERLLSILERSIVEVPYRGNLNNIWVYEIDGNVAGCLIAYPGEKELEYEKAWLDMDLDHDVAALGSPMPMKEAKDDEYYIETIATFPNYRGRGVATQLIQYVIDLAPHEKWSLNCDYHNERAFYVYNKFGFVTDSDIDLYGHKHRHMIYQQ
ncbi:GNAT family N-acetyltransferase [Staphylococcus arlettae]|uniref:GNAT family N-acetyltransferase n=1 Tax=Staphylococcus arlettae TaxID=29378 RepID=UPI001E55A79B|nr:GNAT family N-acetyltransferase [Staphylococcus arlettae]MCD8839458.1 GNAT family N-acetyltransferase [Staphylococcus arlettae]MCD8866760.1 GNAT family N-acetyltransferase [Staphylococcus arlettae]MCD8890133.1 GNAT family N-acetyltransferase [Staphylococcus arlettae]